MLHTEENDIEAALIKTNRSIYHNMNFTVWALFIITLCFGIVIGGIIGIFYK
jgi:hypothetical protein